MFLTIVEGSLGSKLVDTVLDPITITLHLLLALVIIGLIIYSSIQSFQIIEGNFEKDNLYPKYSQRIIIGIMICIIIEIIIGTEIRGGLDMGRKQNALVEGVILLKMLGPFKYIHTILGLALLGLSIYFRKMIYDMNTSSSLCMIYSANFMLIIMGLQIILGESLVFFDVKPLVQLFHMWFSSLLLGLSVVQYTCWRLSKSK